MLRKLKEAWQKLWAPTCDHDWRPASVQFYDKLGPSPARVCRDCDKRELLTQEQFYSQFGENFFVLANQQRRVQP